MSNGEYILIAVGVVALALLVAGEWRRSNRVFLYMRIVASVIAVGSLLCMIFPIRFESKVFTDHRKVILLTEGFNNNSVQSFIQANGNTISVLSTDKEIVQKSKRFNTRYIGDLQEPDLQSSQVHVFGFGFSAYEIADFKDRKFYFHPSVLPDGIHSVRWNGHLKQGNSLSIQGIVQNSNKGKTKIILQLFDRVVDSVFIQSNRRSSFTLKTIPKATGKFIYHVAMVSAGDTIDKGSVPVVVDPQKKLNVLMLTSAPGFENNFLKNWLSDHQYNTAVRSLVSAGKYYSSYLNTGNVNLNVINTSLLQKFNILIADASALNAMSGAENGSIRDAVIKGRIGLVINADTAIRNAWYSGSFIPEHRASDTSRMVALQTPDSSVKLSALTVENYLRPVSDIQPLITDTKGNIYTAATLSGSSPVIATTITNSYTWKLSGQSAAYDQYWTTLLEKASGNDGDAVQMKIVPFLPKRDEPVQLISETNDALPRVEYRSSRIQFMQDPIFSFRWSADLHPSEAGWQAVKNNVTGENFDWYVFEPSEWTNAAAAEKVAMTTNAAGNKKPGETRESDKVTVVQKKEVPKLIFFILFLPSMTFLWVENRRRK